jgi:tRNA G18 (ribose-2'-O)-methylase SpoU
MTKPQDYWVRHESGDDRIPIEEAQQQERFPFYVVLDNLRSAHNVGSIFRTGDGANISGLLICGFSPVPPHRHLAKTALGAVDVVPWRHFETVEEAIADLKCRGIHVLAIELMPNSTSLFEYSMEEGMPWPVALVMGNEKDGLTEEICALCDDVVHLPMCGHKNSLNVSVAFGAAIYEVLRRYMVQKVG